MDKNIGKKLDGRYEITELIGVGGMAEVYKGVDVIDNKTVAIKILKKEFAENEEFLRRFRNESKAIAVLSHPNIVKIYDVGFSEKIQYIVMEYIDGITLKEYIEEERVLSWKDTVHFVIQILRALQHAHDKGIVHRDIKPQNIMMFTDGTIKVMDFGIAKFAREEGKTATDQAIGSVHYISPEQASGNVTDAKSDIYSVGAMMYEMLTGRKPFDSDNPVAIAVMHMHDIPERPRQINPDIPDGLEEIVLRAMEKAPEDRYQTTAEMISDIEAFKADPHISFGYYTEDTDENNAEILDGTVTGGDIQTESRQEVANAYASKAKAPVTAAVMAGGAGAGAGAVAQRYNDAYPSNNNYSDEDDEDEEEERSSLVVPVLTAVVVVVIIVAVIFVATMFSGFFKNMSFGGKNKMPDLYGVDYNMAVSKWGNSIKFEIEGSEYDEADENAIIKQSIEAGSAFSKGAVCKVTVSKGMETVEVPHVENMNIEIAKAQLTERGLEPDVRKRSHDKVLPNYVISSEPSEGTQVHKGSQVILYVSMGANAEQMEMENYVGKTADDAAKLAGYKNLKVVTETEPSYEKEGIVVRQDPEKGTKIEGGSTITLYVSDGTIPDGKVDYSISFPSDVSGRFCIDFIIDEKGKTKTESSGTIICPQMGSINKTISGSGKDVNVTAILTNLTTSKSETFASYTFNFANGSYTKNSEDIYGAFERLGGFPQPETEAPTDPPTQYIEPTTNNNNTQPTTQDQSGRKPGVNGIYDDNGNWIEYKEYENGDWEGPGNSWRFY
ncbi:MAG: Stk1 family PASTA domain-containing Ser/Thr kinase [Ruminococcus sp.]|uniref:Stk1 family PASTA domain-containing Ser/Thr kinase n=1 Tax=Ruminococcus sp. TaxID=41978 RepID=UPI0025CE89E0|nr:Stk1 family PASTA domain-containing Ser/Thr kinase [Ruminococcus sp.]MCR5601965.1 Stk1 family PASTA domain-containing Ser/Thr kinase [Ruminococcus sp.]